jgi:hypothetical protein
MQKSRGSGQSARTTAGRGQHTTDNDIVNPDAQAVDDESIEAMNIDDMFVLDSAGDDDAETAAAATEREIGQCDLAADNGNAVGTGDASHDCCNALQAGQERQLAEDYRQFLTSVSRAATGADDVTAAEAGGRSQSHRPDDVTVHEVSCVCIMFYR